MMANAVTENIPALEPLDPHNERLQANVHPPHWRQPKPKPLYDLVVVGAGTAGLVSAAGAAGLGAKVALVEKALMGGDCLNVGCVPSKALIRSADVLADLKRAGELGVRVAGEVTAEFPLVMERLRRLRAGLSGHDSAQRFSELGVDVFIGEGRFIDGRSVGVDNNVLRFKKAVIATGARAVTLPIPGLAEAGYLTNETLFSLTELPRRLAVIGAGPIGCEMAQAFARLGSQVTLLEQQKQLLPREDRDAAAVVEKAFREDGIQIDDHSRIVRVISRGGEKILELEDSEEGRRVVPDGGDNLQPGGKRQLCVDAILIGVGRAPNVEGLNLEAAGVQYDARSGVKVDECLRTTNRRIFAGGDICSPYKFTHAADAMARIIIQNALFFGRKKTTALIIPWCTYTDPEIAHVGLYAAEIEKRGVAFDTIQLELAEVDRAVLDSQTAGFLKVHVERKRGRILGATLVASHAGEMISELTVAMAAGMSLGSIGSIIHPYPTQASIIKQAADAYNRKRLTPRVSALLQWMIKLNR